MGQRLHHTLAHLLCPLRVSDRAGYTLNLYHKRSERNTDNDARNAHDAECATCCNCRSCTCCCRCCVCLYRLDFWRIVSKYLVCNNGATSKSVIIEELFRDLTEHGCRPSVPTPPHELLPLSLRRASVHREGLRSLSQSVSLSSGLPPFLSGMPS